MEKEELKEKIHELLSARARRSSSIKIETNDEPVIDRETYLAYAFIRGIPYSVIESKINEDKFELPKSARETRSGLFCFLSVLAQSVSVVIERIENPKRIMYGYPGKYYDEIYEWMLEKYPVLPIRNPSIFQRVLFFFGIKPKNSTNEIVKAIRKTVYGRKRKPSSYHTKIG